MFRGTLQQCVEALARLPLAHHKLIYAIVHFPLSKCYALFDLPQFDIHTNSTTAKGTRTLFHGSLNEAAHFVLNKQLSLLVTAEGAPHIEDNHPPPVDQVIPEVNGNGDGTPTV